MKLLASIGRFFAPMLTPVRAFARTIEEDVVGWVGAEEAIVADAFKFWWAQQKALFTKYSAAELGIIKGLVAEAAKDAAAGDYTAIATDVIKMATTAETAWIASLGADEVASLTALFAYRPKA
jgi:hypothetical protein